MPLLFRKDGLRMRTVLMVPLLASSVGVALLGLMVARVQIEKRAGQTLASDLNYSLRAFDDIEQQRREQLNREVALLADLPSLKALMTTRDTRTIQDAGIDFWQTSGADLFALADASSGVRAVYGIEPLNPSIYSAISGMLRSHAAQMLVLNGRLFELSSAPLYFGNMQHGTLLGYVIAGHEVGQSVLRSISQTAQSDALLLYQGRVLSSTLAAPAAQLVDAGQVLAQSNINDRTETIVRLGGQRYLARSRTIHEQSANAQWPVVQIVLLKSLAASDQLAAQLTRLIGALILGTVAVGLLLAAWITRMVTRPLEKLAEGAEAIGSGQDSFALPVSGVHEVRYLSAAFERMRGEIKESQERLLEAERLATIGRMASSISHDLRHYLAAVYANAEFLSEAGGTADERASLLSEIRLATYGMTDLIDSLLVFSRTGMALRLMSEPIQLIVERALALVRVHPQAEGVSIEFRTMADNEHSVLEEVAVDARKLERAIYNLALNACQATRDNSGPRNVAVTLGFTATEVTLRVADNGAGIPESVRESLFEPFVSQGKQSGTGLGLTVAYRVAVEHGGTVLVESSRPGETVFLLTLQRSLAPQPQPDHSDTAELAHSVRSNA